MSLGPTSLIVVYDTAGAVPRTDSVSDIVSAGAAASTFPYATGSFTIATGRYLVMSRHLILTSTQRVTLAGTATLRIT